MSFGQEVLSTIKAEKLVSQEVEFIGCTENELRELMKAQNVEFIPETYSQLMRVMGHVGIDWLFAGNSEYEIVRKLKEKVISSRYIAPYIPNDAFIFLSVLDVYYFFRTRERNLNPSVYMYFEDTVTEVASTFTSFVESKLQLLREEKQIENDKNSVYYDPNTDTFYGAR